MSEVSTGANQALVLHPYLKNRKSETRQPEAQLEEAIGLARAIDLHIALGLTVPLASVTPSTLFGKGKVEEMRQLIEDQEITLAVIDHILSPVQQRNLEKSWGCKVIDRTALILEIFGARARTREGKLQVELAALEYQKSRLVRSWTHLERQRGGFGFLGGPGESQIEIDRRLIRDRIIKIKKELETVTRTRELHRKRRREVPYPIVALVGYTNAGKSTLFNRLTGAEVLAENKLFATLDPTLRALELEGGVQVILSDTVGFVSDLPHELVAAFRATLEEVLEAEILLHVRDISHDDTTAQKEDVEKVLTRLYGSESWRKDMIEVCNKIDLLPEEAHEALRLRGDKIGVSAVTGEGLAQLEEKIREKLVNHAPIREHFTIPLENGRLQAWLHEHGKVLASHEEEGYMHMHVALSKKHLADFNALLAESAAGVGEP